MTPLSEQQHRAYESIRAYMDENNGLAPTYRELAYRLGVGKATVYEHVGQLRRKGWIVVKPNAQRGITITNRQCPHCKGEL